MDNQLRDYIKNLKSQIGEKTGFLGVYRFTLENPDGSKEVQFYHNLITDVGLTMIANNLTDATPDNDMLITVAALGDDNTTVDGADTTLGNEVYRNDIISMTNGTAVAYATAFFDQTEVDGTFYEAGIFCDADSGTPDDGILLSHVNINVTKTTIQKLTIDWTLELLSVN